VVGSTLFPPIEATGAATCPSVAEPPVTIPSTGQVSLHNKAAELNAKVSWIGEDVSTLHRDVLIATLNDRTRKQVKRSVRDMMTGLGDEGFSWRDIALFVGVTVPAVQKWRRGERASPDRVSQQAWNNVRPDRHWSSTESRRSPPGSSFACSRR